jgi:hypothetical protein
MSIVAERKNVCKSCQRRRGFVVLWARRLQVWFFRHPRENGGLDEQCSYRSSRFPIHAVLRQRLCGLPQNVLYTPYFRLILPIWGGEFARTQFFCAKYGFSLVFFSVM